MKSFYWCGIAFVILSGCKSLGPDYQVPQSRKMDAWQDQLVREMKPSSVALPTWWEVFKDEELTTLIRAAETNNLDLAAAMLRVEEAQQVIRSAISGLSPMAEANGSFYRSRTSEAFGAGGKIPFNPQKAYTADFALGWELDVWGRVRRGIEAARGQWEGSIEDVRDVMVIVRGEIGIRYVQLRTLQQRLRYARQNIELQEKTLKLTQDRLAAELTGELDVRQAEVNLASTRAMLPMFEALQMESLNRLCVLNGQVPGSLNHLLEKETAVPVIREMPQALPAELVRRRPDVRAAERRLAAQTARIGMTEAELYPKFTLNGTFGWSAASGADWFRPASRMYGFGPSVTMPIFNRQPILSAIKIEELRVKQAFTAWEQSVLVAYAEAQNAMTGYVRQLAREKELQNAVTAALRSVVLVESLYRNGLTDFQNVLDTQRQLMQKQDELAETQGDVALQLITLYKAFGGGWSETSPSFQKACREKKSSFKTEENE
jgi:outer membrane protein, multidrug efflux system